jgi:hypothetical protein
VGRLRPSGFFAEKDARTEGEDAVLNLSNTNFAYSQVIPLEIAGPTPEWVSRVDPAAAAMVVRFTSTVAPPRPAGRVGFLMFGLRSAGAPFEPTWLAESGQPVILDTDYLFSAIPDLAQANNRSNARPEGGVICAALWRARFRGQLGVSVKGFF